MHRNPINCRTGPRSNSKYMVRNIKCKSSDSLQEIKVSVVILRMTHSRVLSKRHVKI